MQLMSGLGSGACAFSGNPIATRGASGRRSWIRTAAPSSFSRNWVNNDPRDLRHQYVPGWVRDSVQRPARGTFGRRRPTAPRVGFRGGRAQPRAPRGGRGLRRGGYRGPTHLRPFGSVVGGGRPGEHIELETAGVIET